MTLYEIYILCPPGCANFMHIWANTGSIPEVVSVSHSPLNSFYCFKHNWELWSYWHLLIQWKLRTYIHLVLALIQKKDFLRGTYPWGTIDLTTEFTDLLALSLFSGTGFVVIPGNLGKNYHSRTLNFYQFYWHRLILDWQVLWSVCLSDLIFGWPVWISNAASLPCHCS